MAVDDSDIYTVADGAIYASYAGGWALVGDRVPRFPASTPVAALRPNLATRHALAVGPGSRLLHTSHGEMQPWQPWRPVAGVTLPARAPIGVAARNATAWFAAAVDTSGFLQIIDWNSGWATPRQISVRQFHPRTQVGVAFGPAGRAHVAAADATGQLFVMSWSPAGGAVSEVAVGAPGIAQQAQIALVPFGANRLQVFACTSTGRVVTADWSPGFPWSTFATLSSPTVRYRCVQAVVGFDGRPEAFALDAGGAVAHFTQSTTGWREQPLLAT